MRKTIWAQMSERRFARLIAAGIVVLALVSPALAQTLLGTGQVQFTDANGVPLAGGTVTYYVPGTTTLKDTFADPGLTQKNPNPLGLDAAGRTVAWGTGQYRQVVVSATGVQIWDQVVGQAGGAGGGGAGGSTVFVGSTSVGSANAQVVATTSPANWSLTAGNLIEWRSGFTNTAATTVNVALTGNVALDKYGVAGPTALVGQEVQANVWYTAIYDGTELLLLNPSSDPTVTLPSGVCVDYVGTTAPSGWVFANNGAVSRFGTGANLFAVQSTTFGAGDGSTTFNAADLRGRSAFGADAMGGASAANRLGSNSSSGGFSGAAALGAASGSQAHTPTLAETASHTHGFASGSTIQVIQNGTGASNYQSTTGTGTFINFAATDSAGSGAAFNITPPALVMNKICKL